MEVLAGRIIELRDELGLSSERVAARIGVSHKTVITWEKDRGDPSLENLLALCRLFEVTPDYLLGTTDQRTSGCAPFDLPTAIEGSAEQASAREAEREEPALPPKPRRRRSPPEPSPDE